ncbi:MAG: 3'-5' exonuclease domain-containing protein 2 [Bacteroidales bacterium]|nr:3'-5' exonuclease domain-containing protein 2 [Bacteroidales bacterium]
MFKLTISPEEIEKLEPVGFPGQIHVISRPGLEFSRAIAYLKKQKVLGFDTETKPVFSPGQHHNGVALLQLSGPDQAFLFRIQKLNLRHRICHILSNPEIIKVGAAALDDVRGLQRYREFEPRGFVDLQKIVWEWGIRDKSVKKMAANILGVKISKSQQLSNWEAETLNPHQQLYAATDAWICREMYLKLMESEKHPLRPEEMYPPEQMPAALREKLENKEEAPAPAPAPEKKKKSAKRRKYYKKKKASDEKNLPEKGA